MIRSYRDSDYDQLKNLYLHPEWYGGVFDESRDGRERLAAKIQSDSEAIIVYEDDSTILGTVSIIEDGRVAMLYRFITSPENHDMAKKLYAAATKVLKKRGHTEVLVYSAINNPVLDKKYMQLGMIKGSDYRCFWASL